MLEIQKLAAELGLKCITAYRLDALKSVQQINDNKDALQDGPNKSIQNFETTKTEIEKISDAALGCTQGECIFSAANIFMYGLVTNEEALTNQLGT